MPDQTENFVALWTRYQPDVRRYVFMLVPRKADAEDVLQKAATSLWQKFENYDTQRPFVAWACGFAHMEVLAWRQQQARERLVFSDDLLAQLQTTITEEAPLLEIRRRVLGSCLSKLLPRDRKLILQRYAAHGFVRDEAARTKISEHKLYYAIEKIRAKLLGCIDRTMHQDGLQHG